MFTVLGAGAWGTALAICAARGGTPVTLWGRDADALARARVERTSTGRMPGIALPPSLHPEPDLALALERADGVLIATPCSAFAEMLDAVDAVRAVAPPVVWACKGFEPGSGRLLSEVFARRFGDQAPAAVISGPTFAREVARALPTAVTVAATTHAHAESLRDLFHAPTFRVYVSSDLAGVQVGGALKNVIAIAVGMSDGLGFGANSRAALISRGLVEMSRLGAAFGARSKTLMGLAGLGDLVLTSTDDQSRNRRFGLLLGGGRTPQAARAELGALVEGARAAMEVRALAERHGLELPICEAVASVVTGETDAATASRHLMERAPGEEP